MTYTYVAGVKYYAFCEGDVPLDEGQRLELMRERDNRHDRRAIEVVTADGMKLGYLPRCSNRAPSRLMDAGWELIARIERLFGGGAASRSDSSGRRRPGIEIAVFVPRGDDR